MKLFKLFVASWAVAFGCAAHAADDYPNRPVRILVGATAGGGSDMVARIVAEQLTKRLGQQVIVENRPGAGGNIANMAAVRAPADGYTLAMAYSGLAINPAVMAKMPFDTAKETGTVSLVADVPMALFVNASVPAQNVKDLIELAKASPGKYSIGVNALASVGHLSTELFKQRANIDMPTVVYKGSSAAMTDLLGGTVTMMFDTIASAGPQVQSGRLRMLAVGGPKRLASHPEVPTLAEAGLPDFDLRSWYGLIAPVGTPKPIMQRLSTEIAEIMRNAGGSRQVRAQFPSSRGQHAGSVPPVPVQRDGSLDRRREVVEPAGAMTGGRDTASQAGPASSAIRSRMLRTSSTRRGPMSSSSWPGDSDLAGTAQLNTTVSPVMRSGTATVFTSGL
jgi:tripartite-type tricarboxylate transporter receptor subunit TctC